MWVGVIVIMLTGQVQAAAEVFESKAECEKAVNSIRADVAKKNHPEINFLYGKCDKV
jgi:hypothetical protein